MPKIPHYDFSKIKEAKVTISLTVIVAVSVVMYKGFFGLLDWHMTTFMSSAEGGELVQRFDKHVIDYEMGQVQRRIEQTQDKIADLQLWVSANAENDFTRERDRELTSRLDALLAYRQCLLTGGLNCDSINPR